MQRFSCACGNVLFFGSFQCLQCKGEVGYDPAAETIQILQPGGDFKRCANGTQHGVCNWLLPRASEHTQCLACRMNRTIPDLTDSQNLLLWGRMEGAKRRLLHTLLRLGIPLSTKAEDPENGLAFDILSSAANPTVTMGHLNGVITVNLEEADDTYRQINRQQLGESSRTLLGHFRHESAHYLWQRFLSSLAWEDSRRIAFRERFGDEWTDYAAALAAHYQSGPPPGWEQHHITAYAASHPWEDWAETWAHYLHIVDGLETSESLGIQVRHLALPLVELPVEAGFLPTILASTPEQEGAFLAWLQRWMCLSTVLNEISHSLGEPPLYPFTIPVHVAQKLRMAHFFAQSWGGH
jgi:hypothetical protein